MGIVESFSGLLDKMKSKPSAGGGKAPDRAVLIEKIRALDLFRDLPQHNLEEMLAHMETIQVKAGETIIREGDEGDFYYLLMTGGVRVTRRKPGEPQPVLLAELAEPVGFGEEALISNAKRNATVSVTVDSTLMRLSKDSFNDFVKEGLVAWLSPKEALARVMDGARWLDVRDRASAHDAHLHGALLIPLEELREHMAELAHGTLHVVYCENGRLSATAAFLMRQRGLSAAVLRGGLKSLRNAGVV